MQGKQESISSDSLCSRKQTGQQRNMKQKVKKLEEGRYRLDFFLVFYSEGGEAPEQEAQRCG